MLQVMEKGNCLYTNKLFKGRLKYTFFFYTHFKEVVLKSVLFETTKKRLINSPEIYGHPFMERPSIYVHILRLGKER